MDDTQKADAQKADATADVAAAPNGSVTPDPLDRLTDTISAVAEQVRAHHDRAAAREKVIDHLHAEVERLRIGAEGIVLRPVVTDMQNLRDDLLRQARTLPEEITRNQIEKVLETFALSVELSLERCGSVPLRPEVGAVFSPRQHRAVKVLPAPSAEQDGTVAEVVTEGYLDTRTERTIAPARVHVWRWQPPNNINDHVNDHVNDREPEGSTE